MTPIERVRSLLQWVSDVRGVLQGVILEYDNLDSIEFAARIALTTLETDEKNGLCDLHCDPAAKRCADCIKFGKGYTHEYVPWCPYTKEKIMNDRHNVCWYSGVDQFGFASCDPPVTLKACEL